MLVDLEPEALEEILRDGVREIIGHVVGGKREKVKKAWFRNMKVALNEYKQQLKDDFLPVLVDDFSKKMVIKFSGGKMSEEDKEKIRVFMEMVRKSNNKYILDDLLRKLETLKINGSDAIDEMVEGIKKIGLEGYQWIMKRLELHVRSVIGDALFRKSVERSEIEVMLYNFVEGEVPDSVKKLFENGMNAVPITRMTKREVDNRVEEALLEFLMRLGRRRIYGYSVLQASGVQDWIDKVKNRSISQESRNLLRHWTIHFLVLELSWILSMEKLTWIPKKR